MFEKYMIMTRGFKNVSQDGKPVGFALKVRHPAYNGIYLSLIADFEVTVDTETFNGAQITFTTGNRTYRLDQLWQVTDAYWPWSQPATLTIAKPGGLRPGIHDIRVTEKDRSAGARPPGGVTARKKMTLVV